MNNLTSAETQAITEVIKGVFSEEMSNMVINAPTDKYLIYTFLVIAVVLIGAVIFILKITTTSTSKTIKSAVEPYIIQIKSFEDNYIKSVKAYNEMVSKFNNLKEELIRFQTLRLGEEDMFSILRNKFDFLETKVENHIQNTMTLIREHERNSFERHVAMQKLNYDVRLFLTELKFYCGNAYAKSFGSKLIDTGYITKEQLEELLKETLVD